jgi:hypothetical protein
MAMKVLELPASGGPIREPYVLPPKEEIDEMKREFERLDIRKLEGLS